jgi:hypothetical protein
VFSGSGSRPLFVYGPPYESLASVVHRQAMRGGASIAPATDVTATTVALDEYCARRGIERIDLLKLDAEGAEVDVLDGAARLLGRGAVRAILVEVGVGFETLVERLAGAGFGVYTVALDGRLAPAAPAQVGKATNVVAVLG